MVVMEAKRRHANHANVRRRRSHIAIAVANGRVRVVGGSSQKEDRCPTPPRRG